jgi:hypothetical protein
MQQDEIFVPAGVLDRLGELLQSDGFKRSSTAIFIRDIGDGWRAWIAISGFSFTLMAAVGVYNETIIGIARKAMAIVGPPSQQKPDTGPPLIMADLDRLIGDDPYCLKHLSWSPELPDPPVSDPASVPDLKPAVADDLVYCLRKKAYPFFDAHRTFQNVADAMRYGKFAPSPACINYFPLILIELGRRAEIPRFLKEQIEQMQNEEVANRFKRYVETLLELVPE